MKAKTIYIFEGDEKFTIVRGFPLRVGNMEDLFDAKIKHKGIIKPWIPIKNVNNLLVETEKNLGADNNKTVHGWNVRKINMDYDTGKPLIKSGADVRMMGIIENLKSELLLTKQILYAERNRNMSRTQKDKLIEKIKKDFKFAGEAKNLLYTPSDSFGGYMGGSRFGMGGE